MCGCVYIHTHMDVYIQCIDIHTYIGQMNKICLAHKCCMSVYCYFINNCLLDKMNQFMLLLALEEDIFKR